MKTYRATVCEDEVYCNVETIAGSDEHLGTFSSLAKAEAVIDEHYCERYPGHDVYDRKCLLRGVEKLVREGAAKPGQILKHKRKRKNSYTYASGLIVYTVSIEEIK